MSRDHLQIFSKEKVSLTWRKLIKIDYKEFVWLKNNEPWGKSGLEQYEIQGLTHFCLKPKTKAIAIDTVPGRKKIQRVFWLCTK